MVRYTTYRLTSGELTGAGPRRRKEPAIFVAYRFRSTKSKEFRLSLEERLGRFESFSECRIVDGHTDIGSKWASEIRRRLEQALIVIADLTNLSPDVLFECGFARGLGKSVLPVLENVDSRASLPSWLTEYQVGHFADQKGWEDLITSIAGVLNHGAVQATPAGSPVPGRCLLLRTGEWLDELKPQFSHIAKRFDMTLAADESVSELDDALLNMASSCSLIVAGLHNTDEDAFVHFVAGMLASKPTAGAAQRKLKRRIILVVHDDHKETNSVVSESAVRVRSVIHVVRSSQLSDALSAYGELYESWSAGTDES